MPKGKVKTQKVNKYFFKRVLRYKNTTIKSLAEELTIGASERTIRRALDNGAMRPDLLLRISEFLDTDPDFLSGKKYEEALAINNDVLRRIALNGLHPELYPFYRKEHENANAHKPEDWLQLLLPIFNISLSQYSDMCFDEKYSFLYDLYDAIFPVVLKHFPENGYGQKHDSESEYIFIELENWRDDYYFTEYLDKDVRKFFMDNPPKDLKREDIEKMSIDDLFYLDAERQFGHEKNASSILFTETIKGVAYNDNPGVNAHVR